MRHICRSLHALKGPIRGCKLMLDQLAACGLSLDALNEAFPGAKYVILYRQSIAEQYLSRQSAKATDQWVLHEGQQPKQARVPIDPADLQSYGADIRQAYRQLLDHAWLPQRSVLLSYEELSTDPARCFAEQICPLLGLPPARPETMLRKQNTLPLDQRVANYCEVATLLSSSVCRQHYSWSHTQFLQQAASAAAN
jgi:LPS sulfotransferase NodH